MSLPPGFIDELRSRLSIGQVVGRKVMWDNRKSNPGKGDLWSPCPFHQEKTASFHVDDQKGFYYCFGCHAKGDAFRFVQETENVGFMEAVQILAGEAGMPMPERDPRAQEKADHRTVLSDVMEQAVQWYRMQLRSAGAAQARAYLEGRGFDQAALDRWEIGFAPDMRQGVFAALTGKGVEAAQVIEAGLAAKPDDGGAPYDRFRGRIIFPIRNHRGRAIALGGRAMDPNARAKYLNSPETPLFDKGRSLYNHKPAREAAGKGSQLIVAEGYMDTIALSEAGFASTVAPLGTAITEDQLALMWRISSEPVIALDGDKAGLRAAMRLIDLALPLLEAGKSLRFALMPQGMDPDDLIRAQGRDAMQAVIDGALPLVQLLWRRETEGKVFDSPERKAALDKVLRDAIKVIPDPSLRGHYGQEIKDLRWALFNPRKGGAGAGGGKFKRDWRKGGPTPYAQATTVTTGAKSSVFAAGGEGAEDHLREAVILATLVVNPDQVTAFEREIETMDCRDPDHAALRDALLRHGAGEDVRALIEADLGAVAVADLLGQSHVQIAPPIRRAGNAEFVGKCLEQELAKLSARRGQAREIREAVEDIAYAEDERLTHRLSDGREAINRIERGGNDASVEFKVAPNGNKLSQADVDYSTALDRIVVEKNKP